MPSLESVEIYDFCNYKKGSCIHDVKLKYEDNSCMTLQMNRDEIALLLELMKDQNKSHIFCKHPFHARHAYKIPDHYVHHFSKTQVECEKASSM